MFTPACEYMTVAVRDPNFTKPNYRCVATFVSTLLVELLKILKALDKLDGIQYLSKDLRRADTNAQAVKWFVVVLLHIL